METRGTHTDKCPGRIELDETYLGVDFVSIQSRIRSLRCVYSPLDRKAHRTLFGCAPETAKQEESKINLPRTKKPTQARAPLHEVVKL